MAAVNPEETLPPSEAAMDEVEQEHRIYLGVEARSESICAPKLSWASGWFSWCSVCCWTVWHLTRAPIVTTADQGCP